MVDNFCFKCGSVLKLNAEFCSTCGIALIENTPTEEDPFKEIIEDGIEFAKVTEGFDFIKARLGIDEKELEANEKLRLARTPEELQKMKNEHPSIGTVDTESIETKRFSKRPYIPLISLIGIILMLTLSYVRNTSCVVLYGIHPSVCPEVSFTEILYDGLFAPLSLIFFVVCIGWIVWQFVPRHNNKA